MTRPSDTWGLPAKDFTREKTFLDDVHGDVFVTHLERRIIDTAAFQRLRGVKQLGSADLVFHTATHSRFDHSIGTMWVAHKMASLINSRVKLNREGRAIGVRERNLLRLVALLHDIGHAPFGHQLEDDFPLLPKHDSPETYLRLLGRDSEIGSLLSAALRDELIATLCAKKDDEVGSLRYPFIADIVGNTVCADLLDYSRRDVRGTGLDKKSGWRMLNYLFIPKHGPAKDRVVIDAWKADHLRGDVISDILDLLDVRFSLCERVIFHHTKMAAGAMLARAVAADGIDGEEVVLMRDEELLLRLRNSSNEESRMLAESLLRRRLYKQVWLTDGASAPQPAQRKLTRQFAIEDDPVDKPEAKRKAFLRKTAFEDRLCDYVGVPRGSALVSCSVGVPLFKKADSRVRLDGEIMTLKDVESDPPQGALNELRQRHAALWRFYVFLDPDLVRDFAVVVADAVALLLEPVAGSPPNTLRRFVAAPGSAIVQRFAERVEADGQPTVSAAERRDLLLLAAKGETKGTSIFALMSSRLQDLRTNEQPSLELGL